MNLFPQALRARCATLLGRHLPGRTKRLIFLASLTARLKDSTDLSHDTLSRLNQLMVLANSDSAIRLPVQLSRVIWHGNMPKEICDPQLSLNHHIEALKANMPDWLRYGEDAAIHQDLAKLLGHRYEVLGTPA